MNYHSRIMNILHGSWRNYDYRAGHRDARHAAAEIAKDADALCKELVEALECLQTDSESGRFVCQNQAQACAVLTKYRELLARGGVMPIDRQYEKLRFSEPKIIDADCIHDWRSDQFGSGQQVCFKCWSTRTPPPTDEG